MSVNSISLGRLAVQYVLYYVLMLLAFAAIVWALATYANFTSSNSAMGVVIPMVAAMQAGQYYFTRTGQRPASGFSWRAALIFTFIAMILPITLAVLLILGAGTDMAIPGMPHNVSRQDQLIIAIILGVFALLFLLIHRWFFGMGARQAEKLALKRQKQA